MRWVALLLMSATIAPAQPKLPTLLEQALRRLPGVNLLNPPVDLPSGYTIDQLKGFGYWPPWVVVDLDRDGRPDIVATVVRRASNGTEFGVLAVHAQAPVKVHWIAQFGKEKINGVAAGGRFGDRVTPLYCIECDSNSWFRWSGSSYEVELFAIGERIGIASDPSIDYPELASGTLAVFGLPSRESKAVARVKPCTIVRIVSVQGSSSYESRWYLVEIPKPKRVRAWIPAAFAGFPEDCVSQ
jgi:hypothetical protein